MAERIAVVGNRKGADLSQVLDFMLALHARQPDSLVISGGASGVDEMAESTWFRLGGRIRSYRPAPYGEGYGVEVWSYGGSQPAEVLPVEAHGVQAADFRSAALYRDTLIAEAADRLVAFYRSGPVWNSGTSFTEAWARGRGVPVYSSLPSRRATPMSHRDEGKSLLDARRRLREWVDARATVSSRAHAPTYANPGELKSDIRLLLDATEPQKPRHEWDDVRWIEEHGEYEASCWCGWTQMDYAYSVAENALQDHLTESGVTVG